ncbi:hypothetical protein ACFL6S_13390 [Candidatus Poribacteria bacterium]
MFRLLQKRIFAVARRIDPDIAGYIALAIIVGIYGWVEITHFTPAYQEVDPDGYLVLAKRIARGGPLAVKADDPFMYQSHVWVENKAGEVAPKFAPGYPALMAIAYLLGGDGAMFLVSPLMGAIGLVGAFFLFRLWMSRLAALVAVFCLATNGMVLVYSGYLLTHATNTCFVIWGMFFLWRWVRGIGRFSGLGVGLLGAAMTVRHTSMLLATVLIAAVSIRWIGYFRSSEGVKRPHRDTLILLASYSLFPLLLTIYNWVVFDSPFTTGYGLSGEQWAFTWGNTSKNAQLLASGLNYTGLFLLFPLGIAGIFLVGSKGESLMRFLWFTPLYLLYSSYYWAPNGMAYFRFLIVTFPVIVGSAFALMDNITSSWRRKAVAFVLLSSFIIFVIYGNTKVLLNRTLADLPSRSLASSARRVSKILDEDAAIFSRRPVFCYMGTRRDFYLYDLNKFTTSYGASAFKEGATPRRHPIRNTRFREFYKGLTDADLQRKKRELIQGFLSSARQTAYLLPQHAVKGEQGRLGGTFGWELLDEWDIHSKNVKGVWQKEKWGLYEINIE